MVAGVLVATCKPNKSGTGYTNLKPSSTHPPSSWPGKVGLEGPTVCSYYTFTGLQNVWYAVHIILFLRTQCLISRSKPEVMLGWIGFSQKFKYLNHNMLVIYICKSINLNNQFSRVVGEEYLVSSIVNKNLILYSIPHPLLLLTVFWRFIGLHIV